MIVSFNFPMCCLNRSRDIYVYVPDNYFQSGRYYPVVYINDGQNAFFDELSFLGVSWGFLDYVKSSGLEVIMVAIPCCFEEFKRMDEYGPWVIKPEFAYSETHREDVVVGGEGQLYVKWLIEELKPYIDGRFRTIKDDSAIVGSSMGGVISAYAALSYPEVFCKCAALSTAFWLYLDEFKALIVNRRYDESFRFYFDLGQFEGCGNALVDVWYSQSNEEIYRLLVKKVKHLKFCYFENEGHNEAAWRKRVPIFMEYFYGKG